MGIKKKAAQHFEDYLSEFVYGGIDGAVTTFAVVAGATGARFSLKVILVLGFANLIADGFSMGVGSYLSSKSEQQLMAKKGQSIVDEPSPIINGLTTYVAFIVIGFIPLLVYLVDYLTPITVSSPFLWATLLTAVAFWAIGILKSRVAQSSLVRGVFETVSLGLIAAAFAYVLGDVLERIIT